nr:AAA family ATPase [uncultured Marvinbryantia sp.]
MADMKYLGAGVRTDQQPSELAMRVIRRLTELGGNKAELALKIGCSRSMVSQYLSGKYRSDPSTVEAALEGWLLEVGEPEAETSGTDRQETQEQGTPELRELPRKVAYFESSDYLNVMAVCQSCQEDMGLGIIVGKSGYGKTHALKKYAQLPRVAYLECDDTMSCRDLVEEIESQLGMSKSSGGSIHKRVSRIREFLNINTGYLLIIDEADKLMNKYTTAKMEIIRGIFDQADVGIVIAGEPKLEIDIKTVLARFANRVDFYYKLHGLNASELRRYLEGWDLTEEAAAELACRAFEARNGCFRLLDRTINNVLRVMKAHGEYTVTLKMVQEASGMMML